MTTVQVSESQISLATSNGLHDDIVLDRSPITLAHSISPAELRRMEISPIPGRHSPTMAPGTLSRETAPATPTSTLSRETAPATPTGNSDTYGALNKSVGSVELAYRMKARSTNASPVQARLNPTGLAKQMMRVQSMISFHRPNVAKSLSLMSLFPDTYNITPEIEITADEEQAIIDALVYETMERLLTKARTEYEQRALKKINRNIYSQPGKRGWTWLVGKLWKKGASQKLKIPICENIIFKEGRPVMWLFTSKDGTILRKNTDKLKPRLIRTRLVELIKKYPLKQQRYAVMLKIKDEEREYTVPMSSDDLQTLLPDTGSSSHHLRLMQPFLFSKGRGRPVIHHHYIWDQRRKHFTAEIVSNIEPHGPSIGLQGKEDPLLMDKLVVKSNAGEQNSILRTYSSSLVKFVEAEYDYRILKCTLIYMQTGANYSDIVLVGAKNIEGQRVTRALKPRPATAKISLASRPSSTTPAPPRVAKLDTSPLDLLTRRPVSEDLYVQCEGDFCNVNANLSRFLSDGTPSYLHREGHGTVTTKSTNLNRSTSLTSASAPNGYGGEPGNDEVQELPLFPLANRHVISVRQLLARHQYKNTLTGSKPDPKGESAPSTTTTNATTAITTTPTGTNGTTPYHGNEDAEDAKAEEDKMTLLGQMSSLNVGLHRPSEYYKEVQVCANCYAVYNMVQEGKEEGEAERHKRKAEAVEREANFPDRLYTEAMAKMEKKRQKDEEKRQQQQQQSSPIRARPAPSPAKTHATPTPKNQRTRASSPHRGSVRSKLKLRKSRSTRGDHDNVNRTSEHPLFVDMESQIQMPYEVLGTRVVDENDPDGSESRATVLFVFHDIFDTINRYRDIFSYIADHVPNTIVVLFNYVGQAYTAWPPHERLTTDYLGQTVEQLLVFLSESGDLRPHDSFVLCGFGYGGTIATRFAHTRAGLRPRALVLFNSFLAVDDHLLMVLSNFISATEIYVDRQLAQKGEVDDYSHPFFYSTFSHLFLSYNAVQEAGGKEAAMGHILAVSNPITSIGRLHLCIGLLTSPVMGREAVAALDCPLVLGTSDKDVFVLPCTDNLCQGRERANDLSAAMWSKDSAVYFNATFRGAGHDVVAEVAEDVATYLVEICHEIAEADKWTTSTGMDS